MGPWADARKAGGNADIASLLDGVLANLDLRTRFREHLAIIAWPQIAGSVIASHSTAEAVRDGVLIVAADSSAWAHELHMRQRELLELVAQRIGPGAIREIHFRAGRRRGLKRPFARPPVPRPSEMKIGGREEKHIAAAVERIEEVELQARVARALTALAKMSEWRKKMGWRQCQQCGRWQRTGKRWCASCTYAGGRGRRR